MPKDFDGTFGQHIAETRKRIENQMRLDGETDETAITERAEAEAEFIEAERWLVERWGEEFECPVCSNVQWTVSGTLPAYNSYLSVAVTCRYCGNSMLLIPGIADLEAPVLKAQQLQLSTEDDL